MHTIIKFFKKVLAHARATPLRRRYYGPMALRAMGIGSVGRDVRVGKSVRIVGIQNLHIGNHVIIDDFSTIVAGEALVRIGSNIHIANRCLLAGGGGIEIGDFANISSNVSIYSISDDYSGETMTNPTVPQAYKNTERAKVTIGKHVIIGSTSIVLPGVDVGTGCAIGALTLLRETTEDWGIYAGSPAKRIGARRKDLLALEQKFLQAGNNTAQREPE